MEVHAKLSSPVTAASMLIFLLALQAMDAFLWEKGMDQLERVEKLSLTLAIGPESLAFDPLGGGPYTGVSDGRVLKWNREKGEWVQFANTEKRRGSCDGNVDEMLEDVCGRPLGMQFYNATGDLYVADASFGLLSVGTEGGVAEVVASEADGVPFSFLNGLDIDQENGVVYFTDSSTKLKRRDHLWMVLTNDQTGRLLKYDIKSKKLEVLLKNLPYPNGVSLGGGGRSNSFLLMAETTPCRIKRYWINGPRSGTLELFAELPSYPDNIKKNSRGEFWVAVSSEKKLQEAHGGSPEEEKVRPVAVRLSEEGKVIEVLDGGAGTSVSEVGEREGKLWVGSVDQPYAKVYKVQ